MFYTYILYSHTIDAYYIESSDGIIAEIEKHNSGKSEISKGAPWNLVYYKAFDTIDEALTFKKFIEKQKNKKALEKIIYLQSDDDFYSLEEGKEVYLIQKVQIF